MLRLMGSQRVRQDWRTELNWLTKEIKTRELEPANKEKHLKKQLGAVDSWAQKQLETGASEREYGKWDEGYKSIKISHWIQLLYGDYFKEAVFLKGWGSSHGNWRLVYWIKKRMGDKEKLSWWAQNTPELHKGSEKDQNNMDFKRLHRFPF